VPGVASLSELLLFLQWARTAAPAVPGAVSLSELQSSFLFTSDCSSRARNKTPNTRTHRGKLFSNLQIHVMNHPAEPCVPKWLVLRIFENNAFKNIIKVTSTIFGFFFSAPFILVFLHIFDSIHGINQGALDIGLLCFPRYRCKSHLGAAAKQHEKTKIIVKNPVVNNIASVEYFRILAKYETRQPSSPVSS